MFKNLGLHCIQFPSGKFGFVGTVPKELYFNLDKVTPEFAKQSFEAGCTQFLPRKVWDTEKEALQSKTEWELKNA